MSILRRRDRNAESQHTELQRKRLTAIQQAELPRLHALAKLVKSRVWKPGREAIEQEIERVTAAATIETSPFKLNKRTGELCSLRWVLHVLVTDHTAAIARLEKEAVELLGALEEK